MDSPGTHAQSHFFTLRLWREALGEGQEEWRGRLQHVLSGDVHYFRSWQALVDELEQVLPGLEPDSVHLPNAAGVQAGTERSR